MSDGVKVQFAHLSQAGADIKTGSRDIEQILSDMDAQLQKVTWEGEAQAAYFEAKRKWTEGMAELQRILGEVGNGVDSAVQKYQSMEQHVAQSWM
jgi:WXG100 family type VII secretion target